MSFSFSNSTHSKEELKRMVCEANIKAYSGGSAHEFAGHQDTTKHYLEFVDRNVKGLFDSINKKKLKVLEVGCGSGLMSQHLFKHTTDAKISCLDISQDMLDILKKKLDKKDLARAKFICGDAVDYLTKTKEKFDMICVHGSLHHMMDYMDLIQAASTKLGKGGVFYIANEPLPRKLYNFYLTELFSNWDIAYYKHFGKNNTKFLLYMIFGPINFIKPVLNSRPVKRIKDTLLHGRYLGEVDLAEYWRIDEQGLDLKGIHAMFKKHGLEVIRFQTFSYSRTRFLYHLGKRLNTNRFFNLLGVKN